MKLDCKKTDLLHSLAKKGHADKAEKHPAREFKKQPSYKPKKYPAAEIKKGSEYKPKSSANQVY